MATFTYQEAIKPTYLRYLQPQFNLSGSLSNEALLIRLLVGSVRVTNLLSTDSFDQFENYSILGKPLNTTISTRLIKDCVSPEAGITELCAYIDSSRYVNHQFFLNLLEEVSSYFYKRSKNSYTTGFLHLYRALEYISYSFPLIYASLSRDYYGSFNTIKDYFIGNAKSELTFFDAFTKKLLDTTLLQTPLTFNFSTLSPTVDRNHFNIIKTILTPANISSEMPDVSITTTYEQLIKLVIDLRNRYFHFAVGGQRNIRSTEIIESDTFFLIINEELLNWISIIYFEILKAAVLRN